MKKLLHTLIFFILFLMFNPTNLFYLFNETNQINETNETNRSNQFNPTNRFNQSNQSNQLNLIDLMDSINSISSAWSKDSKTQRDVAPGTVPENYVIGKGDVLNVFVWRNEQLSSEVVVRPDGKISLPLLQDLQAEGLTALQLKEEITRKFSEDLNNPRVTVIVNEINSYKVSVLGKVTSPGVYPISGDTTLVEAISMAGGFTEWANKRKITVITHQGDEKEKTIPDTA